MSENTPSPEEVRQAWSDDEHEGRLEFDRMLASVKADAWDEGAKAGYLTKHNSASPTFVNPYRGEPNENCQTDGAKHVLCGCPYGTCAKYDVGGEQA